MIFISISLASGLSAAAVVFIRITLVEWKCGIFWVRIALKYRCSVFVSSNPRWKLTQLLMNHILSIFYYSFNMPPCLPVLYLRSIGDFLCISSNPIYCAFILIYYYIFRKISFESRNRHTWEDVKRKLWRIDASLSFFRFCAEVWSAGAISHFTNTTVAVWHAFLYVYMHFDVANAFVMLRLVRIDSQISIHTIYTEKERLSLQLWEMKIIFIV